MKFIRVKSAYKNMRLNTPFGVVQFKDGFGIVAEEFVSRLSSAYKIIGDATEKEVQEVYDIKEKKEDTVVEKEPVLNNDPQITFDNISEDTITVVNDSNNGLVADPIINEEVQVENK